MFDINQDIDSSTDMELRILKPTYCLESGNFFEE